MAIKIDAYLATARTCLRAHFTVLTIFHPKDAALFGLYTMSPCLLLPGDMLGS
jgi:hypothetical protein